MEKNAFEVKWIAIFGYVPLKYLHKTYWDEMRQLRAICQIQKTPLTLSFPLPFHAMS